MNILGITSDSREVKKGFLFVAISGHKLDGNEFIDDAIKRGATIIAVARGTKCDVPDNVQLIEVDNTRQFLAAQASKFYARKPQYIAAVTGTNGKTSTVNFCRQIWDGINISGASLGTLGLISKNVSGYTGMTTPDTVALHQNLQNIADSNITHLALEASSQGMDQERLHGMSFNAVGFTNLTQDHLDYHGDMDTYLNAKLKLVRELVAVNGVAVLNADDAAHTEFAKICASRGVTVWTYGFNGHDIKIINRTAVPDGQILDLEIFGKNYTVHLPLVGLFQAMNVLCAMGMVCADKNVDINLAVAQLEKLDGIIGRLQKIKNTPDGIGAYIDYAHTPDGLNNVLTALRPHTTGRLVCVFGCGGDRDRRKRPIMGEISSRIADVTIVTDDNPRSENPAEIRNEIMVGVNGGVAIDGRRNAIHHAVNLLEKGDVLVVAGKGHEQGQIFATHTEPFDDYFETETALKNKL